MEIVEKITDPYLKDYIYSIYKQRLLKESKQYEKQKALKTQLLIELIDNLEELIYTIDEEAIEDWIVHIKQILLDLDDDNYNYNKVAVELFIEKNYNEIIEKIPNLKYDFSNMYYNVEKYENGVLVYLREYPKDYNKFERKCVNPKTRSFNPYLSKRRTMDDYNEFYDDSE